MSEPTVVRDPAAWRQLAHPTRNRIVFELSRCTAARVADLATLVDEPANSVSFHLRTLEKHGFVERTASPGGDGRESWWQLTNRLGFKAKVEDLGDTPDAHKAADEVLTAGEARAHSFIASWFAAERRVDAGTQEAMDDAAVGNFELWLDLTLEERRELGRELADLFGRFRQRANAHTDHTQTRTTIYQGFILERPNRRTMLQRPPVGADDSLDAPAERVDSEPAG